MRGFNAHNTTRLFCTADTFGEIQIVAAQDNVVIDIQTRNYDTIGHLHRDHALACLTLSAASRLRDLLDEAIDHSASVTLDHRQTALWSDTAVSQMAARVGNRRPE